LRQNGLVAGDSGVQIVYVERCPASGRRFGHYPPHELQCLGQAGGEGVLEREWRGLPISGLREIGGQETVDNNRGNLALVRVGQAVAAFDLEQEALGHEEALLFNGLLQFLQVVIGVWGFAITLKCLGEAHGFSAWRAFLTLIVAGLIVILPIALILLALEALS